jgi:hypothetical protein
MSDHSEVPGLECPLLFGLPENKTEVIDGRMRTLWPFQEARDAERAYSAWSRQIERWRGGSSGISLERQCRVLEMEVPVSLDLFRAIQVNFWRRELWDLESEADLPGYDSPFRTGHIRTNLWGAFNSTGDRKARSRWERCCWGDVMLTEDTSLSLDLYYFSEEAPMQLIGGDFAGGVPLFAAQILTPFSREVDQGQRLMLLHGAGVKHVWLLDPSLESVPSLAWGPAKYAQEGSFGVGEVIRPPFCPELEISVAALFEDPYGDPKTATGSDGPQEAGEPGSPMGLEYPLLLGHPGRRHEIWRDHSPCVLAFGSAEEARQRFHELLADASCWAGNAPTKRLQLSGDVEAARLEPFQFTRRRNRVHLDVEVDPSAYRRMLEAFGDRGVWEERNRWLDG